MKRFQQIQAETLSGDQRMKENNILTLLIRHCWIFATLKYFTYVRTLEELVTYTF